MKDHPHPGKTVPETDERTHERVEEGKAERPAPPASEIFDHAGADLFNDEYDPNATKH